ncbi:hypothetical protein [Synechococcus sp. MIT S9509]|nr:hypothetical protein [Synechococcus sp. MIT S9509]
MLRLGKEPETAGVDAITTALILQDAYASIHSEIIHRRALE